MGCIPSSVARKRLETSTIDDVLQDDEFVKQILSSTASLSEKSRRNLLTIAYATKPQSQETLPAPTPATDPDPERTRLLERKDLRAFLTLTEADTSLNNSLATEYQRWAAQPETFIASLETKSVGGPAVTLAKQGRKACLSSLSKSRLPVDRIRRRFYALFFFEVDRHSQEKVDNEEWIACGRKYSRLTSTLGVGCLFFLPDAISDSVWEERLPLKGGYFEQVILLLKRLHIVEKAARVDANRVGNAILRCLLQQFIQSENRELTASSRVGLVDSGPQPGFVDPRLHLPSEQIFYRFPVVAPYDSPIFICIQNGDIVGMRDLWRSGLASIDTVDPYGLGLLYYATYYCWRNCGRATALLTCKALLHDGANCAWVDENGNTPMQTMIDILLAESAINNQSFVSTLSSVAQLYARPVDDLWSEYKNSRGFTEIHEVLLRINHDYGSLDDYLGHAVQTNTVPDVLNAYDVSGRTALAWAVEYGYTDAVASLIRFGADVNQRKLSLNGGLPMLHIALAAPASPDSSGAFLGIVEMLLLAGADVNAVDHEGWTPLHIAASWNSFASVDTLQRCARTRLNWNALTSSGQSAAQLVTESGGDAALHEFLVSHESPGVV